MHDHQVSRHPLAPTAEAILAELSSRQFVRPHRPTGEVVADATRAVGGCPVAGTRAVAWLELDPTAAVGRLKRTELAQLARCLARFARQARAVDHVEDGTELVAGRA